MAFNGSYRFISKQPSCNDASKSMALSLKTFGGQSFSSSYGLFGKKETREFSVIKLHLKMIFEN